MWIILALLQLCRCARAVLGYRQVGNADVEEVRAFELQVAKIQRAVASIVEDRDFDAMRAGGKDLLRGEVALRVDRNLAARYPNRVAGRYAAALHLHRSAAERNLLTRQVVLAVGGQQLAFRRPVGGHDVSKRWLAVQPQRPRVRFVEITLRVIGAQQVLEFACWAHEHFCCRMPFRKTHVVDRDDLEGHGLQGLRLLEYSDFSTLDEARIVAVHPEIHDRCNTVAHGHGDWIRRDAEPPPRLQIVEAEVDTGVVERDVGAALDVGRAAVWVIDRLTIDGDVHHVQLVRTLRTNLLGQTRNIYTLVVVQRQLFVVHDLHPHERLLALDEAGVHDVVRLDVAASFVLGPGSRPQRVLHEDIHSAASPRRGKPDVVAIHGRGAAVEWLVLRVTYKPHSRVGPIRDVRQCATQVFRVAGRNDRLAVRELEGWNAAPGRIVNTGHRILDIVRAQLRLVR